MIIREVIIKVSKQKLIDTRKEKIRRLILKNLKKVSGINCDLSIELKQDAR